MGSSTSITTENSEPHGKGGAYSKGIPAATDDIDAAYSDERPSRGSLAQQDPLTGVLGEMAFSCSSRAEDEVAGSTTDLLLGAYRHVVLAQRRGL